jgi:hypothetical protein
MGTARIPRPGPVRFEARFDMSDGPRNTTNALLAVIVVLLLLVVLYLKGLFGPRHDRADFRVQTPAGETKLEVE